MWIAVEEGKKVIVSNSGLHAHMSKIKGCCALPKKLGWRRPISAHNEVRLKMATGQTRQMLFRSCAWWLCRVKQKVKQQKVRSRAHLSRWPFAQKSARYPPWLSPNRPNASWRHNDRVVAALCWAVSLQFQQSFGAIFFGLRISFFENSLFVNLFPGFR